MRPDDLHLLTRSARALLTGIALALFAASNAHAATTPLTLTAGVTGNMNRVADGYAWTDSLGKPRTALLARNNVAGGGVLDRYAYRLANSSTRTVNSTFSGAGGFGYVVSHLPYVDNCAATPNTQFCESIRSIGDDSPLGRNFTGTYSVKLAGRHHAIHEFKTTYPRFTGPHPSGPAFIRYDVPVTIQWLFVNGRDHPLWSVTWDWSAVPASLPLAQQIEGDSRGPYGEMDFDGIPNSANVIAGVAWAINAKRFSTTSAPFTLNSSWTWSATGDAAIPFNMLWIQGGNAQMGMVQTSLLATHDAGNGGYEGDFQGLNSPAGNRCPDPPGYRMFCVWDWPFQSIENNFYDGSGALSATNNTNGRRLAWGAKLGAIGRASYANYVNATVTQAQAKSYSTFIVLGEHGAGVNPLADQVNELQQILKAILPITATASIGTLATSGPAGIGRSDLQAYTRSGYNPVYSTWDVSASASKATLNWAASGADALKNPVVRVLGYSMGTAPSTVTFNGTALVSDTDYLASIDTATSTLWVTLLRTISGATNTLAINAATVAPVCSMDIDGDGHVQATTDGLIIMRAMLGLRDTAVSSAAVPGSPRSTWTDIREFLVTSCGMVLP
ncbi:MAG: hypothetical protein H7203_14825 [Rhizobacter sp.]|nr:hypothetical protein [Burkholderiales bacterium]